MAEQGGFRQWLANQGGNLRQQFALPRDPDGSVSYAQLFGRGIGSALGGSAFGPLGGAALGRFGQNIGQRVSYMFDNDDTTGFWRGANRGQSSGGFLDFLRGDGGEQYAGPPSLQEPGNRWESPSQTNPFTAEDYARATSQGNWSPQASGYSGNVAQDRATWGDYMGRMTQNMSPSARLAFISQGGMPSSGLRGAERVMAGGSSTTAGMGSMARVWGYSPDGTGVLFNDQRQVV